MPENLRQEMPQLRQAFAKLGVASWHSPGNEADDLAATLTAKIASGGHQVTIISTDKGYCQLLAPSVQIRDYFQKRWPDMPFVQQEFGVTSQQLPDYWGWRGSAAARSPAWLAHWTENSGVAVAADGKSGRIVSTVTAGAGEMAQQAPATPRTGLYQQTSSNIEHH